MADDEITPAIERPVTGRALARRKARRAWFADGARNLRAVLRERGLDSVLPTDDDWYLCPLCLEFACTIEVLDEPDSLLTAEDAPPAWFGGSKIALTCKRCNNESGTLLDSHAQQADHLRQFWSGKSSLPMTVRFTVDGVTTVEEMYVSDSGIMLQGVPAANNPANIERMKSIMDGYVSGAPGQLTFQVSGQVRSNPDRARASWIRAAYVAAFAAFGWRYVLQPAFNPLRAYLRDPTQTTLPVLSMTDPDADRMRREILLVKEPSDMQGVFVACGGHQVILPIPDDQRTLDELSAVFVGGRDITEWAQVPMRGMRVPWPRRPMHLFDPAPVQPSPAT